MAEQNKRDSFLIYRSFIEAGRGIESKKDRLSFYEAIFDFALENKINELQGSAKGMFILVKPQLEANRKKYDNGSKAKQNGSKTEANYNQTDNKVEANVNENVNVNENENEANYRATISDDYLMMTIDDCRKKYDIENVAKREQVAMNLKVNPQQIILLHNNFDQMLKSKVDKKLFKDYTEHFANWASKLSSEAIKEKVTQSNSNPMPKVDMSKYDDYYLNPIKAK